MPISNLAGVKVGTGQPVRIMAVINASPESFFRGSVHTRDRSLAKTVRQMAAEGADFIDVGAMSTAPYLTTQIPEAEEARRLKWAIQIVRKNCRLPISVDTMRSGPAAAGLKAGGRIINDVSGLNADPRMAYVAKRARGLIVMAHPMGLGARTATSPSKDIPWLLKQSLKRARRAGVNHSRLVVDPGIGFFRNSRMEWWRWDLKVLLDLKQFQKVGAPILVGVSRKSFIGKILGGKPPEGRLAGSLAATVAAVLNGAAIIRTHDVAATKDAVRITERL